jgi:hypothetical protein
VNREESSSGLIHLSDVRGEAFLSFVAPNVLLCTIRRHVSELLGAAIVLEFDRMLAQCTRMHLFIDADEMTGYDTEFRSRSTEWGSRARPRLISNHVLVRSKIVAMGVTVANMIIRGNVEMHSNRADFEKSLIGVGGTAAMRRHAG